MIIRDLEACAFIIETGWAARGTDVHFAQWTHQTAKEMAAALRELKTWVYLPQSNTQDLLVSILLDDLKFVTTGQWHYLPRAAPKPLSASDIRVAVFGTIRVFIRAAIPFAIVYVWKVSGLGVDQVLLNRLLIAAFALGAVYLMLAIDPDVGKRIESATTIVRAILGREGKE